MTKKKKKKKELILSRLAKSNCQKVSRYFTVSLFQLIFIGFGC